MTSSPRNPVRELPLLMALVFLSGFAGLVYQVIWLRQLGLLFGNTAYAASTTLTVFFLGLAAGGWVWSRRAPKLTNALASYARLELGIGATALLYFPLLDLYHLVYAPLFATFGHRPALFLAVKFALALTLLFPPAFFMGGTFPVMGQFLVRRFDRLGATATLIYAVNTAGAALGAFLAGFFLPQWLGYLRAYICPVAASLLGALVAWQWSRKSATPTLREKVLADAGVATRSGTAPELRPWVVIVLAVASGFLALALEVLWVRMFAQVLQNSVYTYATILVTFLVALALGSVLARRLCRWPTEGRSVLIVLLTVAGVTVGLSPHLFYYLTGGLGYAARGADFGSYLASIFGTAALVMLVPGVATGTVFPFLFRLAEGFRQEAGRVIGRLAAINTLGGIAGSLLAGFVALDAVGLWKSLQWTSILYIATALLLTTGLAAPGRRGSYGLVALLPVGALLLVNLALDPARLESVRLDDDDGERLLELWQGSHGLVAVVESGDHRSLKVDNHYTLGDTRSREGEERQAHVPLLIHPRPDSVFFLGLGTGLTAGAALQHPVEKVVACELVPEVIEAARRYFTTDLFGDPRVAVIAEDGRNFLLGTREDYDVVIADLFIPWKRGAGSLYTREHFAAVRSRLAPGGHYAQWLPLYQLSREEFTVIARTFLDVFPQTTLWRGDVAADETIMALVGRVDDTPLDPAALVANARRLAALQDGGQEQLPDSGPFLFYAGNLGVAAPRLVAGGPLNTDDRPLIEYGAPVTHRRERVESTAWFVSAELMAFYEEVSKAVPPSEDPYLTRLSEVQIAYVEAGLLLHKANVLHAAGDDAAARFLMAEVGRRLAP